MHFFYTFWYSGRFWASTTVCDHSSIHKPTHQEWKMNEPRPIIHKTSQLNDHQKETNDNRELKFHYDSFSYEGVNLLATLYEMNGQSLVTRTS